jgi:hypothetical protein
MGREQGNRMHDVGHLSENKDTNKIKYKKNYESLSGRDVLRPVQS